MLKIIIEILESHGFPTKNAEELLPLIEGLNRANRLALSVVTNDTEILGTCDGFRFKFIKSGITFKTFRTFRLCALGSQLVELERINAFKALTDLAVERLRLKGGD
jgi:hypothetical protein